MPRILKLMQHLAVMMLIALSGCDERVADVAMKSADRQARQNEVMTDLNKEVASGARNLVTADAATREKVLAVHQDLQAERARLDASWSDLEMQRFQVAQERSAVSILVPAISVLGALLLVALLLGYCGSALGSSRTSSIEETELNAILIECLGQGETPPLPALSRLNRVANGESTPGPPEL